MGEDGDGPADRRVRGVAACMEALTDPERDQELAIVDAYVRTRW
ncbi:hypothetical protein [Streptomyces capparidis]